MNSAKHPAIRIEAENSFTAASNAIHCIKGRNYKTKALGLAARAIDFGNWEEALVQIAAARKENKI